ncbi:MAG: PD-(D/E)XK nuclease family protein [Pseudomonadales bacterium]|nr:PD-(D/E)XK nuclease family protein [Pseudomonadales bacterium]
MPESFAHIPPHLLENFERSLVLTPNERLARELSNAFDNAMIEDNRRAWTTLRCQSLRRFWLDLHTMLREAGLTHTRLLPAHIINMRFQRTAPDGLQNQCRSAVEAWMLIRRYGIDLDSPQMLTSRNAYFSDWCHRAEPETSSAEVVEADLPGLLCKHIDDLLPLIQAPPLLIDIEHLAPDEIRFFEKLDGRLASGVALYTNQTWHSRFDPDLGLTSKPRVGRAGAKSAVYRSYETPEQELMAASKWCRNVLQATPSAHIGVVVPNLDAQYDRVLRQFSAALSPESGSSAPIFDVSGGNSLVNQPVWRHARILLDWLRQPADQTALAPMLNSPFLSLPWCSDLKSNWPEQTRRHLQITTFARAAEAQALLSLAAALPSRARLDRWIKHLRELLTSAKWPMTNALGSFQYQATEQIQEILATLALQTDETLLTYEEALNIIDWSLDKTFAPQRLASNIQILGLLESTGLTFTHLWVCGMSAEQFPGKAKLSSFISRGIALAHGLPRSSQTQELAFAERMLDGWLQRSAQICFSFAQSDKGMPMEPTTLLGGICDVTPDSEAFTPFQLSNRHPHMQPSKVALIESQDSHGSATAVGLIAGGSGRLETQAACPFMSFAAYRLGLPQPADARDLLDARERGSLLHWVLEKVYSLAPDSNQAQALAEDSLTSICAQALKRHGHLPKPFAESEKSRLIDLVKDWLALEAGRDTFEVVETEQRHTVSLGDWQLQVRIDRLDKVGNDLVVIDYKSGKASTAAALSELMTAPQLPLYSLIRDDIVGVYYAQLRHDDQKIVGVGDKNPQLVSTKHRQIKTNEPDNSWAAQQAQWRHDLEHLAGQIGAGDARVNPQPNACRYCHLKSLCRVDEKRKMAAVM